MLTYNAKPVIVILLNQLKVGTGKKMDEGTESVKLEITPQEIGRVLSGQRKRVGLSQGDIAKAMGYVNINFISMIEAGKSKIPVNKIDSLVDAYQMNPEFILVVLRSEYPEYLAAIIRLAKRIPRIFKEAIADPDIEIEAIYKKTLESIAVK